MNRIAALPRRDWRDRAAEAVPVMTHLLRSPGGTQSLHPFQAVGLLELFEHPTAGQCCFANVGQGKTLHSALAPVVLEKRGFTRPMIVVPGALKEKTVHEFQAYRQHWKVVQQYWLESYTMLAQESRADLLEERQPDVLIFDEPDPLRNVMKPSASAVSKRVHRYIAQRRARGERLSCIFLGATPDREAITDYAPMLEWALADGSPVPRDDEEIRAWSSFLDGPGDGDRGAFEKYFGRITDQEHAWDLYRERVISTPGVIIAGETFSDVPIEVHVHVIDPGLPKEFEMLRTTWQRPDGWDLADADENSDPDDVNTWSIWGVARQMSLGFYYRPDPPPPKEWASARKAWFQYVRALIEAPNSRFDTEKQVRSACERSVRRILEWERWRDVKDTFKPNPVPVWMSRHALDAARAWGAQTPGIVWVDHVAFGRKLAEETGWTYYGQRGVSADGRRIEDAPSTRTVIASRLANQRGRNLQHQFNRNLIMAMPNAARDVEQLLGRTHRQGQTRPVHVDVYAACVEHLKALTKVARGAERSYKQLSMAQKWLSLEPEIHGEVPTESWAWRSK